MVLVLFVFGMGAFVGEGYARMQGQESSQVVKPLYIVAILGEDIVPTLHETLKKQSDFLANVKVSDEDLVIAKNKLLEQNQEIEKQLDKYENLFFESMKARYDKDWVLKGELEATQKKMELSLLVDLGDYKMRFRQFVDQYIAFVQSLVSKN